MPRLANRVWETCNAPGTGTVTLLGANAGPWQSFASKFSNGDKVYYVMVDNNAGGTLWECGWGTWNTGNTLTRVASQVEDGSSGAGTLVNFTGNPIDVYCDMTAGVLSGTTLALGASGKASAGSTYSTAIGVGSAGTNYATTATGSGAMALGGSYASGVDSFAAAIANNTSSYGATGPNCVAIGYLSKASAAGGVSFASGYACVASGGYSYAFGVSNQATAQRDACLGGEGNTASGQWSTCIGGVSNTSSGKYSISTGAQAVAAQIGKHAHSAGQFSGFGDAQVGKMVIRAATTDATPKVVTADAGAAGAGNQLTLSNNQAMAFDGIVVAKQSTAQGTAAAAWQVSGLITRGANAASTTLVASTVTAISNTPGWTIALSADTTNGGLAVTFTGAAATNIRTVATLRSSEVIYA